MAKVKKAWPPNIEAIRAVLPVTINNIFAYDRVIYNPGGGRLSKPLIAHEEIHFEQHRKFSIVEEDLHGVEGWWVKFLASPDFRLLQELPAHRVEYRTFCHYNRSARERAQYLRALGLRLSAPMYGNLITANEAMKAIR